MFSALSITLSVALAHSPLPSEFQAPERQSHEPERWRAALEVAGGELPFVFEIVANPVGDELAFVFNGSERVSVPRFRRLEDGLRLEFPHYDSVLEARFTEDDPERIEGTWTKVRGAGDPASVPFHAVRGAAPRFVPRAFGAGDLDQIAGRWRVDFESSEDPAVGIFGGPDAEHVEGTFLTETGDYRFLAGRLDGDLLRLSCFDGAHAFLFTTRIEPDGSLTGTFDSGNWHQETWSAVRDEELQLRDAFTALDARLPWQLASLTAVDLEGRETWLGDPNFAGRPLVVQIFGSWCPNCHDEAGLLSALSSEFASQLEFLGLAFELTGDIERDARQVERYGKRWGLNYPLLLAGTADKGRAAEALGLPGRVIAFPTTLFIDATGHVTAVHSGFAGPATGAAHERTVAEFRAQVERLLEPPAAWPQPAEDELWHEFGGRQERAFEPHRGAFELPRMMLGEDPVRLIRGGAMEIGSDRFFRTERGWRDVLDLGHGLWPGGAPADVTFMPAQLDSEQPTERALACARLRTQAAELEFDEPTRGALESRLIELLDSAHGPTRREAARALHLLAAESERATAALAKLASSDPLASVRQAASTE